MPNRDADAEADSLARYLDGRDQAEAERLDDLERGAAERNRARDAAHDPTNAGGETRRWYAARDL